jgi:hypothetical protein
MMTRSIFTIVFLITISFAGKAQINLVGAATNQTSGMIDIVKWQALDSSSVQSFPTMLDGYYMSSSVFDAYNSNYYLTGITDTASGLFSFNTSTNSQSLSPYTSYSNIAEIDMSTGKIYNLRADSADYIIVNEYDIKTGTDSLLGIIYEPGIIGIVVDATGFDSNNGILYYVGPDGSSELSLFGIHVRDDVFSYTKMPLTATAPGNNITSVNYDNVNDLLFAMNATFDSTWNYTGNEVVEIDIESGLIITRGELEGYPYYLAGSSSFDQSSGSLLLVGFDTNFVERMIVFNTNDNTFVTGFIPGNVSEIICDNALFALNNYIITSVSEAEDQEFSMFPNPATDRVSISVREGFSGDILVSVFSMDGRLLMQRKFQAAENVELSLGHLTAGAYLVKIFSGKKAETTKLIIH